MRKKDAQKIMDELREDYNLTATTFARSRDRMWEELKFLFDYAKENEEVLDLGCGNGRFSKYLEKTNYVGVDFSKEMIVEAKKRFPNKKFLVGDVLNLPFEKERFDKVYSIAMIHQIPSDEYRLKAMKEIRRVLKEGGRVFLTVWNVKREEDYKKVPSDERAIYLKRKRYYYLFKEGELSSLAKKAGLTVVEEDVIEEEKRSNFYLIVEK